jgi:hypothetical protein
MLLPAAKLQVSPRSKVILCLTVLMVALFAGVTLAEFGARDPGVRLGPPGAGGARPGLTGDYPRLFTAARDRFKEVNSVSGNQPGSDSQGLGPRYNGDSCAGCHVQPDIGGTSPAINPEVGFAMIFGARNDVPPFVTLDGPIREARFVRKPNGAGRWSA